MGQAYLSSLPALPEGKTRMTDKTPANFSYVGLIRLALPGAKIIHTLRDPVDTCFSCFSRLFTESQHFYYDLAELGRYYRLYRETMDHWRSVLPAGSILDVAYEDVVGNLEEQARRLLDFCGLPWDDRCLSFHKTDRPVATPSRPGSTAHLSQLGRPLAALRSAPPAAVGRAKGESSAKRCADATSPDRGQPQPGAEIDGHAQALSARIKELAATAEGERRAGRLAEAQQIYRQILEIKPDSAEAHVNLGNLLKEQGQLQQAVACYQRALAINGNLAEAHNNLVPS